MKKKTMLASSRIIGWMVAIFLLLIICIASLSARAQYIGFNGQGTLENRTEQSDQWLKELFGNEPFTYRFPGGAATKYCDPLNGNGWGINYTIVDTITALYGSDEEEATADAVKKWQRKADAQPSYNYLDDIVAMQAEYPAMRVIYSANYLIPADRAFYPIQYLLDHGVNLVVVEMGNESYSQMNYDFDAYWARTRELAAMVEAAGVPIAYPVPATGLRGSKSHDAWISALNAVIDGAGVVAHPYYDGREFSGLKQPVDTALAFNEIFAWDFNGQFQEIKNELPNAGFFIVTESNSQPASLIGDTELNAFLIERLLLAGKEEFQDFCIHNGVAPDKYGVIYGNPQKKNTSYDAFAKVFGSTVVEPTCDTVITYTEVITPVLYLDSIIDTKCIKCDRFFFYLFNSRYCKICNDVSYFFVEKSDTTYTADTTYVNCQDEPEPAPTGCINPGGSDPDSAPCKSGSNDDYLHPERFLNADGSCKCDEPGVVFDHRINTKWQTTIRDAIYDSTGVWINSDLVDFYITLPETEETVVFYDVFNTCDENGNPTWFNTNEKVFAVWPEFLTGRRVHTFDVVMLDRETGINISLYWQGHTTMTLLFVGL